MNTTALTKKNTIDLTKYGFNEQALQLITDNIAKEASPQELALFLTQCQRTQLDPFSRQIYCIGRWDNRLGRKIFTTQISIDGARLVAERSLKYEGQDGPYWCGPDGVWKDIWLDNASPSAAKVGVYKAGFQKPLYAVANWSAYAQTSKEGSLTSMWSKFPALMIGKVAEMLALRRAFPMELSGLYSTEEMGGTNKNDPIDVPIEPPKIDALPPGSEIFKGEEPERNLFFATMEQLGVPNNRQNIDFIRDVFRQCKGHPMNEMGDIVLKAIRERKQ